MRAGLQQAAYDHSQLKRYAGSVIPTVRAPASVEIQQLFREVRNARGSVGTDLRRVAPYFSRRSDAQPGASNFPQDQLVIEATVFVVELQTSRKFGQIWLEA